MNPARHVPVLLDETLALLGPERLRTGEGAEAADGERARRPSLWLDGTVGLGGHARALLERAGDGARLLGVDKDPRALERAAETLAGFGTRVRLARGSFARVVDGEAGAWLGEQGVRARRGDRGTGEGRGASEAQGTPGAGGLDGILLDLGVSSLQLDTPERGFSFSRPGPLDMRMDPDAGPGAAQWLELASEEDLILALRDYGEERRARPLARAVLRARDRGALDSTAALARVAEGTLGRPRPGRAHPATRLFQALRIAVNHELEDLEEALPLLASLLAPGGRLAVISFHSLEDRRVKDYFRREGSDCVCPPGLPECRCGHRAWLKVLTPRAVVPGEGEIRDNPRARSAKLRAVERL